MYNNDDKVQKSYQISIKILMKIIASITYQLLPPPLHQPEQKIDKWMNISLGRKVNRHIVV